MRLQNPRVNWVVISSGILINDAFVRELVQYYVGLVLSLLRLAKIKSLFKTDYGVCTKT